MAKSPYIAHPLKREGTLRQERFPQALAEAYFRPDERDTLILAAQTAQYARLVKFYNDLNLPDGNWQPFFEEIYDYEADTLRFKSLEALKEKASVSPHLALFLAFLELLGFARNELNQFTRRHLDFYYQTLLRLKKKQPLPDRTFLIFSPARQAGPIKVPAQTRFKGGKDQAGKELHYVSLSELIVNQATVEAVKTLFARKEGGFTTGLFASNDPTSGNQTGKTEAWPPFGTAQHLPAKTGFAVASPILNLSEGRRRISLRIPGIAALNRQSLTVEYTAPDGWEEAVLDTGTAYPGDTFHPAVLLVKIEPGKPPLIPYQAEKHNGNFLTRHPVLRFSLKPGTTFSHAWDLLQSLRPAQINLTVQVNGVKNLLFQTDAGLADNTKPFLPFGPNPQKSKSTFYIGKPEIFNKYLKSFNLALNWKGLPGNLQRHYQSWNDTLSLLFPNNEQEKKRYFDTTQFDNFEPGHPPGPVFLLDNGKWKKLELNKNAGFSSKKFYDEYRKRYLTNADTRNVFKTDGTSLQSSFDYPNNAPYGHQCKYGFIRLELAYDFGHAQFPSLLTRALMENAGEWKVTPPEMPYTPEFNHLHIDYTAETNLLFQAGSEEQFFHVLPFGSQPVTVAGESLLSRLDGEGHLMIGLKGISSPQSVSLLFRLEPHSGNLEKLIPPAHNLSWHYLAASGWRPFKNQEILTDSTLNFSTSGIIRLALPAEALTPSAQLPAGLVWLRLSADKESDAYPRLREIHAQAVEVEFVNNQNELQHLSAGLPAGTISKPTVQIPGIQKINQPEASFGGQAEESSADFYTRISERLRHKNRAWNIWDYERLLLAAFPEIIGVKCLSHSNTEGEFAPGQVRLILLPDPSKTNPAQPLTPRVGRKTLEEAQKMIERHTSLFATTTVTNPDYELLEITVAVSLRKSFSDVQFYRNQLNLDLQRLLAPWIAGPKELPHYGKVIYQSQIVKYLEELAYIDHVFNLSVRIKTTGGSWKPCGVKIQPSCESIILSSTENHRITITDV